MGECRDIPHLTEAIYPPVEITDGLILRFLHVPLWAIILPIRNARLPVSVPIQFRLPPSLPLDVGCHSTLLPAEGIGVLLEVLLMIGAEVPIEVIDDLVCPTINY